jgi:hypothetical protein
LGKLGFFLKADGECAHRTSVKIKAQRVKAQGKLSSQEQPWHADDSESEF